MICFENKRFHFIGIGGVGVNALARYAMDMGGKICGSDARFGELCKKIQDLGAEVYEGTNAFAVERADYVIYSSAIKPDHPELARARELGIPIYERQSFLYEIASKFKNVIGIAGTHGKTTTTAMVAHILSDCEKKFVAMIGGDSVDFGNYVNNSSGGNDIFLVEACEYKRNFLSLNPTVAVVTNVECDHPDCYQSFESVKSAFDEYISKARVQITMSCAAENSWEVAVKHLDNIQIISAKMKNDFCEIYCQNNYIGNLHLYDSGEYNYKNATFALAVAFVLNIDVAGAIKSLCTFKGVARRFEYVGKIDEVPVYFDFAHHPTEISCVLKRASKYGKILAVFQPHTYSRTKAYFDDFVKVFGTQQEIGNMIFMPTYAAREKFDGAFDADAIANAVAKTYGKRDVIVARDKIDTLDLVKKFAKNHDIVLFIGAGDIYDLKADLNDG